MVLTQETIDSIKTFVFNRPRAINEIAQYLNINWRTADRYVKKIQEQTGHIQTHTFREGSRGSLKVVFWSNTDKIYSSDLQEKIFNHIERGINKQDFSPIEIYEYVDPSKRDAYYEKITKEYQFNIHTLYPLINNAKQEIFMFMGNCAWIHFSYQKQTLLQAITAAAKRGVIIKILTNVTFLDKDNLYPLLGINRQLGKQVVQVRHEVTPLRSFIFDEHTAKFSEVQVPQNRPGQPKQSFGLYYAIFDEQWIAWLKSLFFKKFQLATPAQKRLDALESIRKE